MRHFDCVSCQIDDGIIAYNVLLHKSVCGPRPPQVECIDRSASEPVFECIELSGKSRASLLW